MRSILVPFVLAATLGLGFAPALAEQTIPLSDSVVLYERLKTLNRNARLTVFDNTSHEAVEAAALNDQGLWDWLAGQRLDATPAAPAQ